MKMKLFNKKYIAIFLVKEQNSYTILSRKLIKATDIKVRFNKKKLIPVDISHPTYTNGLKLFYLLDITSSKQLHFDNTNDTIDSEFIDVMINSSLIKDLTANMTDNSYLKMNILSLIIGIAIGAMAGFIVASYIPLGVIENG